MSRPPPPSEQFAGLFEAVQRAAIFEDSKTFADATPRYDPAVILASWCDHAPADADALRGFVTANFELPPDRLDLPRGGSSLANHIAGLWPKLTQPPSAIPGQGSALPLGHRHVVPGGRFRELYYWDSYFTMLGLLESGHQDLVEEMIAAFGGLLDRYGMIPNGTRSYYLSRSHPPVFYLMAALSSDRSFAARHQRLTWMRAEHDFWMDGADHLAPGEMHRRAVRLPDGSILNRYWDDRPVPRDESWREDVALATATPDRAAHQLWRDLRAGAESGWDFSSRWLDDPAALASIRTTQFLPIDLNALLHGLERAIANEAAALADDATAAAFAELADARRAAIEQHLWSDAIGCYADHDLRTGQANDRLTGAAAFALFGRVATPIRAQRSADAIATLLRPGGLLATPVHSGQQWDAPNGWAPLQWVAVKGLRAFNCHGLADQIVENWLAMIEAQFLASGVLLEKYDVERCTGGGGGEYPAVIGFGWTNGVTLAMQRDRQVRAVQGRVAAA